MVDRTANQVAELIERQEAHEARQRVLMLLAAKQGTQTPPHIIIEIREIQDEVIRIAVQITRLQSHDSKATHRQHMAENTSDLTDVSLQLSSSTEQIRRFQQVMFSELIHWFDDDKEIRLRRQRTTTLFYVAILVMLAIDILIRFYK